MRISTVLLAFAAGIAVVFLLVASGHAQTFNISPCMFSGGCGGAPVHAATGDTDLDRAVSICDAHAEHVMSDGNNVLSIPDSVHWPKDYAACYDVVARWNESDVARWNESNVARRQAEARRREEADRAWLNDYAKGTNR